jgi:RHS repeat-associated protein
LVYSATSSQAVESQTLDGSGAVTARIVRKYDTLGRLIEYTDAAGVRSTTGYDLLGQPATVNDGLAIRTFGYDEGTERRGLPTSVTDSEAGRITGEYDADGNLVGQAWPNGVRLRATLNETGDAIGQEYDKPGCGQANCVLYIETATPSVHGQWTDRVSTLSRRGYGYDAAGRLGLVRDTVGGECTTRAYAFDKASNRTRLTTYQPGSGGVCQTATGTATLWTYDNGDRPTTAGYAYDSLGRTTTVPAADTAVAGGGPLTVTYHANNMVRTIGQGSRTATYTLDVIPDRFLSWTDNAGGTAVTRTNHYNGDGDSPSWTAEGDTATSRVVAGLSGVAAVRNGTSLGWMVTDLHGDFVAGIDGTGAVVSSTEYGEAGQPRNAADAGSRRYGWLGAQQRAADTPGGLVLMGARLYTPGSGRFLSTDPVYGGSANSYEYCNGDPVNCSDVTGEISCRRVQSVNRRTWPPGTRYFAYKFKCVLQAWEVRAGIWAMRVFAALYGLAVAAIGLIAGFIVGGPPGALLGGLLGLAATAIVAIIVATSFFLGDLYADYCRLDKGIWVTAGIRGVYRTRWPYAVGAAPYGLGVGCNSYRVW